MSTQSTDANHASFDGACSLRCLNCGWFVRFEELGGLSVTANDETYFDCTHCGVRNEVRATPRAGLGTQPRTVVVRLLERNGA